MCAGLRSLEGGYGLAVLIYTSRYLRQTFVIKRERVGKSYRWLLRCSEDAIKAYKAVVK
jgi:hypothetical protein